MELIAAVCCWKIINKFASVNRTARRVIHFKRYRLSGILIQRQNSHGLRGKQGTDSREAQSRGRGLHSRNIPCIMNAQTNVWVQQVLLPNQPIAHSDGMKTAIFLLHLMRSKCHFHADVSVSWLLGEQTEQNFKPFRYFISRLTE
jgi:hypothetical protein